MSPLYERFSLTFEDDQTLAATSHTGNSHPKAWHMATAIAMFLSGPTLPMAFTFTG